MSEPEDEATDYERAGPPLACVMPATRRRRRIDAEALVCMSLVGSVLLLFVLFGLYVWLVE